MNKKQRETPQNPYTKIDDEERERIQIRSILHWNKLEGGIDAHRAYEDVNKLFAHIRALEWEPSKSDGKKGWPFGFDSDHEALYDFDGSRVVELKIGDIIFAATGFGMMRCEAAGEDDKPTYIVTKEGWWNNVIYSEKEKVWVTFGFWAAPGVFKFPGSKEKNAIEYDKGTKEDGDEYEPTR